jgi:hypothetical protein
VWSKPAPLKSTRVRHPNAELRKTAICGATELVGEEVEGDDGEDAAGEDGGGGDEEE